MNIIEVLIFLCFIVILCYIRESNKRVMKKIDRQKIENDILLNRTRRLEKRYSEIHEKLLSLLCVCVSSNKIVKDTLEVNMDSKLENLQNLCIELEESIQDFKEGNVNTVVVNSEEVAKKLFNDIYDNPDYMNIIKDIFMPQEESDE